MTTRQVSLWNALKKQLNRWTWLPVSLSFENTRSQPFIELELCSNEVGINGRGLLKDSNNPR